jgi:hypothetical protein
MAVTKVPMQAVSSIRSSEPKSATPYPKDNRMRTSSNRLVMEGEPRPSKREVPSLGLMPVEVVVVEAPAGALGGTGTGLVGAQ